MPSNAAGPLSIFISYSHRDEDYKNDLVVHLANLKRQGKIRTWQDRDIEAGADWDTEIKQQLESAEIILLLVTPWFLASDYCYDLEMQRAVQRHEEGTARVIPIIVKPCDWQGAPFSKLQAVPKDAQPITTWSDQDEAFLNVVQSIRKAVESLQAQATSHSPLHNLPPLTFTPPSQFSTYNPDTFTGRDSETATLTERLQGNCRIAAIVGMTGIGKTALGERVFANINDTQLPYYRFSLDDYGLTPDFASSGAALLRTLGKEPTLNDQKDPANLLTHILQRLGDHPCRVQIDSLERLLRGNEQEGWSEFCDPLWLNLLQKLLAGTHCPSQLLLTSQDTPADLDAIAYRYPQFWHCEHLQGLSAEEQQDLFQKLGLNLTESDWDILQRIGTYYDGHPLVLQVIAEEIRQPRFQGNIALYWQRHAAEFTDTTTPTNPLAQSRLFRRRVRQQVKQSLQRLPGPARQMLCACAVFRRPVPIEFWYAMLPNGDPQLAFDTLQDRYLIEYAPHPSPSTLHLLPFLIKQHNLIRSIAYDLLKTDTPTWESAERQAAHLWLTVYQHAPDAPNLEKVRGYLEALDHYCEVEDWIEAVDLTLIQLDTGNQLSWQLFVWGYFRESIPLHWKLLKIAQKINNRTIEGLALDNLGLARYYLGQYNQATEFHYQALAISREIGNRWGEGNALDNLGSVCYRQGLYEQAIEFHQQALAISHEIGNRWGKSNALDNLGNAYRRLGWYEQAIEFHQQALVINREIGNYRSEGCNLGHLGAVYLRLGQYEQAIALFEQNLIIAKLIRNRTGESAALGNLGNAYHNLGKYKEAIKYFQEKLAITQEIHDCQGEGTALVNIGENQFKLGQYSDSLTHYEAALKIFQEIGDKESITIVFKDLTELYKRLGEIYLARQYCQQALALAIELNIPLAEECKQLKEELEKYGEDTRR